MKRGQPSSNFCFGSVGFGLGARLTEILSHPKVAAYFQTLDVDVQESANLFRIIDNGDGEAGFHLKIGPTNSFSRPLQHLYQWH